MSKIVIFGNTLTAELALYYLQNDSEHEVVAFTVEEEFIEEDLFHGLPLVPFEKVEQLYPPAEFKFFAPLTEKNMNQVRARVYEQGLEKEYGICDFVKQRQFVVRD